VLVLGATGPDLVQVVSEARLQQLKRTRPVDTHRTEMAHVEDSSVHPAGHVLRDRPFRVRKGHFPTTEVDKLRTKLDVFGI
jgi:hypothetical protein